MKHALYSLPLFLLAFAGCTESNEVHAKKIDLYDDYFGETEKTVPIGTEVEFENEGKRDHTVTIHFPPANVTDYELDDQLAPGEETEFGFDQVGTYHVFCRFHGKIGEGMHVNVTVTG